jgi:hypothetical protein
LLTQAAFANGLPADMSGPVHGFVSSTKRFTHEYTSHPEIKKVGMIADGALTLDSRLFSDFVISETEKYTTYESQKDDCRVEILIPKLFSGIYMISVKRDDGTFIGYTIKKEKTTEPNQRLQTMPRRFPFQLLKSPARHV